MIRVFLLVALLPFAAPAQGADGLGEGEAYTALRKRFGRPRPAEQTRAAWAAAQVKAASAHLRRFPSSPRALQLHQWIIANERDVLRRFGRAAVAIDRLALAVRSKQVALSGGAAYVAQQRVLLARVAGDRDGERAALDALLALPGVGDRALHAARLRVLETIRAGQRMPGWASRTWRAGQRMPGWASRTWRAGRPGPMLDARRLQGRVLLLDFWTARSMTCEAAARRRAWTARFGDRLVIVGVPLDRRPEAIAAAVRRHRIGWAQIFDPKRPGNDHPLVGLFGAAAGPTRIVVRADGILATVGCSDAVAGRYLAELCAPRVSSPGAAPPGGPASDR